MVHVAHEPSDTTFAEARAAFPVLEHVAYLNAGTFGPLSRATVAAMRAALDRDLEAGRSGLPFFTETLELREELRSRLGALVCAEPGTVALTSSTTEGCNIVLAGLGLDAGDEIVTTTDEHFGLLGALAASGARVVVVEPDPDRILAAVGARTRLIATSQVLWTTGACLPVRELREHSGVPVLVDGAQSAGTIPVDVTGFDFFTISGQKWLCGPDATGALVVADPERLRIAAPSYFSQQSHERDGSFEPRDGAPRFEQGWWPPAAIRGLLTALDERPAWAFDRARETAERLRERLAGVAEVITPRARATLVSFRPEGVDPPALVERLREEGVHVRELPGRGLVRASVGYWTSDDDLDRLVGAL
jgi:selenocysteine lyase/cysteine desulfurase